MPIAECLFNLFLAFNTGFAALLLGILTLCFVSYTLTVMWDKQVGLLKRGGIFIFLTFLTFCFASFTWYAGTRALLFYNEAHLGLTLSR